MIIDDEVLSHNANIVISLIQTLELMYVNSDLDHCSSDLYCI